MAAVVEELNQEGRDVAENGVGQCSAGSGELSDYSSGEEALPAKDVQEKEKSRGGKKKSKSVVQGGRLFSEAFAQVLKETSGKDLKVLGKCKESLKRRREEMDDLKQANALAKKHRGIMSRGRKIVPSPGEDPAHDQRERDLRKLATRGVVRLFNTVSKFKKQAIIKSKEEAAKNKKRFLSEMRKPLEQDELRSKNKKFAKEEAKKRAWAALQDSFTGLDGGAKNWDQYDSDESERNGKDDKSDESDESGSEDNQDDITDDDDDISDDEDDDDDDDISDTSSNDDSNDGS